LPGIGRDRWLRVLIPFGYARANFRHHQPRAQSRNAKVLSFRVADNGANVKRLPQLRRTLTFTSDATRVTPVRLAFDVLFPNDAMPPLTLCSVPVPYELQKTTWNLELMVSNA
jgi:hypothetical protein